MAQLHMTGTEIASDFPAAIKQIISGAEIVIDRDGQSIAVIKPTEQQPRSLPELIQMAEQRERERGYAITLDDEYAEDISKIVRERNPGLPSHGTDHRHQRFGLVRTQETKC